MHCEADCITKDAIWKLAFWNIFSGSTYVWLVSARRKNLKVSSLKGAIYPGAITGDGEVSLMIRSHLWYGTIFLFLEQIAPPWRHISARIHAHVGGSRVDVVTFRDQMVRVARFSCRFFTARQGIRQWIRSRAVTFMLWADGKGEFFRVENKTSVSRCEWIISVRASWTRKLLRLFCKEELWKKTVYSGIELIWEFLKQCLILTRTCFW